MEQHDDTQRDRAASASGADVRNPASHRPRSAAGWLVLGLVGGTCVTLAVLLTSGLSFADEAGQPFGAPAVSITPTASVTGIPSSTPGAEPTHGPTSGPPVVIGAPPPVTVDLEDDGHGDKSKKGSDGDKGKSGTGGVGSGSSNSGTGSTGSGSTGSGSSGSGSGSSGSNGSGSGSSGSNGSGSGGSGGSGSKGPGSSGSSVSGKG